MDSFRECPVTCTEWVEQQWSAVQCVLWHGFHRPTPRRWRKKDEPAGQHTMVYWIALEHSGNLVFCYQEPRKSIEINEKLNEAGQCGRTVCVGGMHHSLISGKLIAKFSFGRKKVSVQNIILRCCSWSMVTARSFQRQGSDLLGLRKCFG